MNIVYIHTHDSGRILSPYGYDVNTPNLHRFCEQATLFRQAYSVAPTCSPSRAGLLTGRYPHSNGMLGLTSMGFRLNDYSQHLVQFLKSHGYHTALCGIQHEGGCYTEPHKSYQVIGYDEDISVDSTPYRADKIYLDEKLYDWDLENGKAAAQWLKNRKDTQEPFFLSFGLFSTHRDYPIKLKEGINPDYVQPPYPMVDNAISREDFAYFKTATAYFDEAFKMVIDVIDQHYKEDTIVIVTTDHGMAVPFSKGTLYDTGIGVSLIMRVPGASQQSKVIDHLVSHVDVYPTLCDLLKIEKPKYLQGISFAQWFEDPTSPIREDIFAESNFHLSYEPIRCIRTERYKYIYYADETNHSINEDNIDNSSVKEFYYAHGLQSRKKESESLFDLFYDSGERYNLVNDPNYQDILKEMRWKLCQYQEDTNDPLLSGPIEIKPEWSVSIWSK